MKLHTADTALTSDWSENRFVMAIYEKVLSELIHSMIFLDYNRCVEEPGFCLNNATCERTLTSARCHCTNLYQGDRCDNCIDKRFQGDGCQECSPRFQGDDCQRCAQNYYDENCGNNYSSEYTLQHLL